MAVAGGYLEGDDGDGFVGRNPISNGFVNLKAFVCRPHIVGERHHYIKCPLTKYFS